ncbi:MAG: hypothetical protein Q9192_004102 [Flavoplaca navasiana]
MMEPIAVIGMAARLPEDEESGGDFWEMIKRGHTAASEIPKDRINMDAFYHPNADRSDTTNVRSGHFLKGNIAAFDAPFFTIKPTEAESMDPQQRMLLETSFHALENAGISMELSAGSQTGVYFAASTRDYEVLMYRDPELTPKYMGTGIGTSLLANRVSWFFDFLGPSITLDTACSGSLTAVHLACQSLRNRECSMALTGGGSLILAPEVSMSQLSTLGFLSPDGRSYSFDSRANGYAKGEGLGMVVLKRYDDAIRDGDTIRAIIRATSINQDGHTPGITQPSKKAQSDNILRAYRAAGLNLDHTTYFEAHGTGTPVGDPFEAEAIHAAFERKPGNPLYIGSLKANIGHLEAGAGIAAIIKCVLILEAGTIPPNTNFEHHNPEIPIDLWNLKFLKDAIAFSNARVRRISVNSFGYGGTNAHAILDGTHHSLDRSTYAERPMSTGPPTTARIDVGNDHYANRINGNDSVDMMDYFAESRNPSIAIEPRKILPISAADENGIERLANAYSDHFKKALGGNHHVLPQEEKEYLTNLTYTLCSRRSKLPWKAFAVVQSCKDLVLDFTSLLSKAMRSSDPPSISYVFTGQGAQWYAMAQGLSVFPVFLDSLQKSQRCLTDEGCDWTIEDEFNKSENASRVDEPRLSQTLCTILQMALVDLLTSWRFKPAAVTGHSSGEIAAAYCAGVLSHASAIKIAYYRGLAASSLLTNPKRQGAMIAVGLSVEDATLYIEEAMLASSSQLSVGCVNAPKNITITGDRQGINLLQKIFDSRQIFAKKLKVPIAYHSYHMEEVASEYHHHIQHCLSQAQSTDFSIQPVMFSSVTGGRISPKELGNPDYWVKNLTNRVKFSDSLSLMARFLLQQRKSGATSGKDVILEVGPHSALQRPVKDTINAVAGNKDIEYDSLLSNTMEPLLALASAIGRLWCRGCLIDLSLVNYPSEQLSDVRTLTNLPAYPFNHSQSYWVESRLSKNFKFREYPRHELLGVREADWNPLQPKWRNVIRVAEHPWIHDHKFDDTRLYPASATIVMAIEAARQLAGSESGLSDYELSDMTFPNGFVLPPEATTVETQLHFYPHYINGTSKSTSHDFTVFALAKDIWTEICTGTIEIKLHISNLYDSEDSGSQPQDDGKLQHDVSAGWERVNSSQFYDSLVTCGYDFGPAFQNLGNIRFTEDGEAAANVLLDGWTRKVESHPDIASHVIHPTTLDAFFQLSVAAHSQGGRLNIPVLVPTQLKSLYISGELLNREPEQAVNLLTRTSFRGFREADFSIRAVSAKYRVQLHAKGFRQTALNDQRTVVETQLRRSCYLVDWKADLDMLSREEIMDIYEEAIDGRPRLLDDSVHTEELVALYFMHQALMNNPRTIGTKAASHLNKYMLWMQHRSDPEKLSLLRQSHPDYDMLFGNDENRDNFLSVFAQQSVGGRLVVKVGRLLAQVMCGEVDALELLFGEEKILNDYYASPSFITSFTGLISYIDLAAHKNPVMNILEVGAGTGSLTGRVLESLLRYSERSDGSKDGPRMQHYTFSDISTGFFEDARQKFKDFSSHLTFAVFDLEKDPLSQGYQLAQYDMVIASLVLHATTNLSKTLGNIRKVLKPGGKLILFEPCAPEAARVAFVFGLLPGWWLSEEKEREWSPLLKPADWHEKLLQNGFSGVDVHLPDHKAPAKHTFSGMVTTAIEAETSALDNKPPITVIAAESLYQLKVAERIQEALSLERGAKILSQDQFLASNMHDVRYISLLELDSSFFEQIDEDRWSAFKSLVTSTASILWVTQADSTPNTTIAELGMVTGLGRAIRSENMESRFIQLALEPSCSEYHVVEQVLKVHRTLLNSPPETLPDHEFQEKNGRLCIGRLAEAGPLNQDLHQDMDVLKAVPTPFGIDPKRRLELAIETPGLLNTLQFRDDPLHDKPLGPTDVEIEVQASGVNFKDILIALGRLAADHLGFDCAGFVSRAGPESGYCLGDRVCACTITGGYKTFVRTDASAVITVPETLSLNLAAGIPIVFNTVYYSLVTVANLQQGESVLIHSGAGGIGQAAIQLAQRLGAHIFTTVGSDQKRALIMKLYNIPSDHIFSSRNMDFVKRILSITDRGVNVVLNSLRGRGRTGSWSCLAPLGRFVDLGKPEADSQRKGLPMAPFANNVSFHSVSLDVVMHTAKPLMRKITSAVSDLLNDVRPITTPEPLHVFPVSRIEEAFRFMQTGQNDGKTVVEMLRSDIVPVSPGSKYEPKTLLKGPDSQVLPSKKPRYYFKDDATYIIAGGLGGLGRSIVQWMVGRNARHFLLLSRSGTDNNAAARDLIAAMKARGIFILAPRCDITDEHAVKRILEECKQTMPPIKGCIQASMVLKVFNPPRKKTP